MFSAVLYAQTFTTGNINLSSSSSLEYAAQVDITTTEVTLTLIGPSDRWLALGFGVNSMTRDGDVVIFDGTNLTDRTFLGIGFTPELDGNQDWSIASNTIDAGTRTLVATRALNTGETNDYVFSTTDTSLNLVWARGSENSFALSTHGTDNRGIASSGITLGADDFEFANNFRIIPNPGSTKIDIKLSNTFETGKVEVYNILGKQIFGKTISNLDTSLDVSNWSNGVYLISVEIENKFQTKRFIKQ